MNCGLRTSSAASRRSFRPPSYQLMIRVVYGFFHKVIWEILDVMQWQWPQKKTVGLPGRGMMPGTRRQAKRSLLIRFGILSVVPTAGSFGKLTTWNSHNQDIMKCPFHFSQSCRICSSISFNSASLATIPARSAIPKHFGLMKDPFQRGYSKKFPSLPLRQEGSMPAGNVVPAIGGIGKIC